MKKVKHIRLDYSNGFLRDGVKIIFSDGSVRSVSGTKWAEWYGAAQIQGECSFCIGDVQLNDGHKEEINKLLGYTS